jgi:tetratricopeptide (TPR) repeat protein
MDLKNQIELELYFADHFDTILFPVLANIYLDQGDLKRARKVCDIGLGYHHNDPAGRFTLAQIEKEDGNLIEVEKELEHVLLYSEDHLNAAMMLCEIQTVLGRASSRLLKSWRNVLALDPENETAQAFIKKVAKPTLKKSKKKKVQTKTAPKRKKAPKIASPKPRSGKHKLPPEPAIIEPTEPLKVSTRLATFTLVAVLKNQGLFDQALEVLDALEGKGEDQDTIARERKSIQLAIKNSKKD